QSHVIVTDARHMVGQSLPEAAHRRPFRTEEQQAEFIPVPFDDVDIVVDDLFAVAEGDLSVDVHHLLGMLAADEQKQRIPRRADHCSVYPVLTGKIIVHVAEPHARSRGYGTHGSVLVTLADELAACRLQYGFVFFVLQYPHVREAQSAQKTIQRNTAALLRTIPNALYFTGTGSPCGTAGNRFVFPLPVRMTGRHRRAERPHPVWFPAIVSVRTRRGGDLHATGDAFR